MKDPNTHTKTIARNTLYLYFRTFLIMLVSLYTSRLILKVLGINDYGIFIAVGGLVSMSSLISGTMYVTISRFMTYELGRGDNERLRRVFSTSINIQFFISLIILFLAETIGLWFLNTKMYFPEDRIVAVNCVYQCSLLVFVIGLLSAPYNAVIIAHEKMSLHAYFSVLEALFKLLIVMLLASSSLDKLVCYSFLLVIVSVVMRLLYACYCRSHFSESRFCFIFDKVLIKEIGTFAGWNNLGAIAAILRNQGLNVMMNLFFGVPVNAARGIASQVDTAVEQLAGNISIAFNPQITKSIASGDKQFTNTLIYQGAKYGFYLVLLLLIPILFETKELLDIWLDNYPEYTALFVRLSLFVVLVNKLSDTLTMSLLATGDIKKLHIMVGCVVIPVIPLSYWLYSFGMPPYVSYLLCAFALFVKFYFELILTKKIVGISLRDYCNLVLFRILKVTLLSFVAPFLIFMVLDESLWRFFILTAISLLWTGFIIYNVGISLDERLFVRNRIVCMIRKCCFSK